MNSEILIRRYDKAFDLYDSNGNGYVEEADLKRLQGQFLEIFEESPTSTRAEELAALWGEYWQGLLTMMDHVVDGRISRQEWRDGHTRLVSDDATYHRLFTPAMTALFRLMDTDSDGQVGPAEWAQFPAEHRKRCFRRDLVPAHGHQPQRVPHGRGAARRLPRTFDQPRP